MDIEKFLEMRFEYITYPSTFLKVEIIKEENNIYYGVSFDTGTDIIGKYLRYISFIVYFNNNKPYGPITLFAYKIYCCFNKEDLLSNIHKITFSAIIPKDITLFN